MKIFVKSHKRKGRVVKSHMRDLGPWDLNEDASNRHRKRMLKKVNTKLEEGKSSLHRGHLEQDFPWTDYELKPKSLKEKHFHERQLGKGRPKDENEGKVAVPYHEVVNGMRVQRVKYVDSKTLAPNELKRLKMLKINQNRKIK